MIPGNAEAASAGPATSAGATADGPAADDRGSRGRGLITNTALRIGARVASSAMLGLFMLLVARVLGVAEFGHLILAYTLGMAIGMVVGMGAPVRIMRANATEPGTTLESRLYVFHSAAALLAFAVALGVIGTAGATAMFVAGATFALSDTLQNYAQSHLAGLNAHSAASALIVGQRAVPLAVCGIELAVTGTISVSILILAFAVTSVIALMAPLFTVSVAAVREQVRCFRGRPVEGSASYWALSVSGVLTQLQVPAVALLGSAATVGFFSMATRVTGPLTLLSAAVSTVLIPELAARVSSPDRFRKLYRGYLWLAVGYCVLVVALAWPMAAVILLAVGEKYHPAEPMLLGMIVAAGISSISQSMSAKYVAVGRPAVATVAITVGGALILMLLIGLTGGGFESWIWLAPIIGQICVLVLMTRSGESPRPGEGTVSMKGVSMKSLRGHGQAILVALAVVIVLAAGVLYAVRRHDDATPAPAATAGAARLLGVSDTADQPGVKILVVGDSFTEGTNLGGKGSANWTRLVQAKLSQEKLNKCPVVLRASGRGGSGYVATGTRLTTFGTEATRLESDDLSAVVFVGSGNDIDRLSPDYPREVADTVRSVQKRLPNAQYVMVGPIWIKPTPTTVAYQAANDLLNQASQDVGARFVDPVADGWFQGAAPGLVATDNRHPTDEGHKVIAQHMLPIFEALGRTGRCA